MSSAERRVYPEVFRCNPELGQTGQELGLAVGEVSCAVPAPRVQRGLLRLPWVGGKRIYWHRILTPTPKNHQKPPVFFISAKDSILMTFFFAGSVIIAETSFTYAPGHT